LNNGPYEIFVHFIRGLQAMTAIDPKVFRAAMSRFASGVTVISYMRDGRPAGMTANAFLSVSMEPPLVLVSVRKSSQLVERVQLGSRYGVNLLAESQRALSPHFGGRHNEDLDVPFVDVTGTPLVEGSLAHVVAQVVDIHPAGDHLLFIGRVEHLALGADQLPLIYYSGAYKQIQARDPDVLWQCADGW
jgi:flavin reductase (DIM6/NTAB) family NADH-FMN oxidoreductase RutF